MKIHVSELEGRALDFAVAMASGIDVRMSDGYPWQYDSEGSRLWNPTRRWSQCGPLIDKYNIWLFGLIYSDDGDDSWKADVVGEDVIEAYGETPKIAICRAVVLAKIGEEVEIPDELVG